MWHFLCSGLHSLTQPSCTHALTTCSPYLWWQVGAIIAALWISYISDSRKVFLISALWGLFGWFATIVFVPDTTGLELKENDLMQVGAA